MGTLRRKKNTTAQAPRTQRPTPKTQRCQVIAVLSELSIHMKEYSSTAG